MKRIEPGMLCLVISGPNAGRECTVVRAVSVGDQLPEIGGGAASGIDGWLIAGPSITTASNWGGPRFKNGYAVSREHRLMPLSGGDKLEDLYTAEDLEVTA